MQILWSNMILKLILGWLWCLIHMAISLFDLWSCLSKKLECYLISFELLSKYQILHLERLKCLGVVVDSREAKNVMEVKQLLHWFSTVGIKYVVLYDIEGVTMSIFLTCFLTWVRYLFSFLVQWCILLSYHLPVVALLAKNRSCELLTRNDWKQIRDLVSLIDLFYIPFSNSPPKFI